MFELLSISTFYHDVNLDFFLLDVISCHNPCIHRIVDLNNYNQAIQCGYIMYYNILNEGSKKIIITIFFIFL